MTYLTLDDLLVKLQKLKDSGVPGAMAAAIPSTDHEGRPGWVQRGEGVGRIAVAKSDMDKANALCKAVATHGVDIIVIR